MRYGTNGVYVSKILTNGTSCNNNVFGDPVYGFVKQCEYRDASDLATVTTPTISPSQPFSFSLSNSGDKSVVAGSSVTNSITTALLSGNTQGISFSVSGLLLGASGFFSLASCNPSCTTILSVNTTGSTPAGNFPITVTSTGGGVTKTTAFTLSVALALTVAPPPITQSTGTGNVYYVDQNCGDITTYNPATRACTGGSARSRPTINGTLQLISGGDTVLIRAGTYNEYLDTWAGSNLPSGSSWSNATTVAAYPQNCSRGTNYGPGPSCEVVILLTPGQNAHPVGLKGYRGYIIIDGIIIDGNKSDIGHLVRYDASNPDDNAHHTRLINLELRNGICMGILGQGSGHEWVHNNIHDNGGKYHPLYAPQGCHGFYVALPDNLIDTNHIWNHTGWGIHVFGGYASNTIVRNNYVHDNARVGILLGSGFRSQAYNNIVSGSDAGFQHGFNTDNNLVYNNTIYANNQCMVGDSHNIVVKNNICSLNGNDTIGASGVGTVMSNNLIGIDPKFVNSASR